MIDPQDPRPDPTDAALAARLREVMPPQDLRRNLLALAPRRRGVASRWWMALGAMATVIFVACGILFLPPPSSATAVRDLRSFLVSDFSLEVTGRPLPELQDWLAGQGVPNPEGLPAALAGKVPEGCRVLEWNGYRASLICFETASGVVHLVTFPAGTFTDLSAAPRFVQSGSWTTALWKTPSGDFMLFGETDPNALRRLL